MTKFLGILIDDRLNWKEHISLICSKLSRCIAIIYKAKHLLDKESLVMLYMIHYLYHIYNTARKFGEIPTKLKSIVYTYYKRKY